MRMSELMMANDDLDLKSVEMSLDASRRISRGELIAAETPLSAFLDWLVESGSFECAVWVPERTILQQFICRLEQTWPRVLVSTSDLRRARPSIEKAARSGFRLVIGVRSEWNELEKFFTRVGYRVEGSGLYAKGGQHDPTVAAWNKEAFMGAVRVASKLCRSLLCVFAHDADPVYVLYNE